MVEFIVALIVFVIFVLMVVGYIANIVKLVRSSSVTGMTLARVCGIFVFPLGAILGAF
jgi:hypothetical protein